MEKIYLTMPHCDLHQIAESGQCFRWEAATSLPYTYGGYIVCDGADQALLGQLGDGIALCCEGDRVNKWLCYLDAGTDYGEIISSIPSKDQYLRAAAESAAGLRILNADLWEIMVSFIISQNNNIPRIRKSVAAMCEKLGEAREGVCGTYHTFPTPEALADIRALQGLGLGYRDKYIARLAQNVCYGKIDLAAPQREPERQSRTERMFGSRDTWDTPAQPRNPDSDQGPYKGFLMIRCEECGEVKAYNARRETYGFKCKCGHETPLEKLRPMFMHCKCGKTFRYKTNLTDKQHTHICMDCGSPVDMEINSRGTAYVTIGERR